MFKYKSSKDYQTRIETTYYLLLCPALCLMIYSFLNYSKDHLIVSLIQVENKDMLIAVVSAVFFVYAFVQFAYLKRVKKIRLVQDLREQLDLYYKTCLTFGVTMQILSIVIAVLFFIYKIDVYAGVYCFLISLTSAFRPGKYSIPKFLRLNSEKRNQYLSEEALD